VTTVDFSISGELLSSLAVPGYTTVVMVTSPACHSCLAAKPRVEAIPANNRSARVVLADIGRNPQGGINGSAPVISRYRIQATPAYFVFDASGRTIAQGDAAARMIAPWMGSAER
jgi:hypothetical protein